MKAQERKEQLQTLNARFKTNMHRHGGIAWAEVLAKLEGDPDALRSLQQMEATGGEPDVIGQDKESGHFTFCDCSAESPIGRRSTCYDAEARASRKEHKPERSAVEMAAAMGIDLLTEESYRELQRLGDFDTTTSSWIKTPSDVRALGGALFCDRRYGRCSSITTARSRTTLPEASAVHLGSETGAAWIEAAKPCLPTPVRSCTRSGPQFAAPFTTRAGGRHERASISERNPGVSRGA
jgi:hypothetical protein